MSVKTTTETNTVNPVGDVEVISRRPSDEMVAHLDAATRAVQRQAESKAPHGQPRN